MAIPPYLRSLYLSLLPKSTYHHIEGPYSKQQPWENKPITNPQTRTSNIGQSLCQHPLKPQSPQVMLWLHATTSTLQGGHPKGAPATLCFLRHLPHSSAGLEPPQSSCSLPTASSAVSPAVSLRSHTCWCNRIFSCSSVDDPRWVCGKLLSALSHRLALQPSLK
jgi:hypothetical protein